MRMDKMTIKAQEALQDAQAFAAERGHQNVEPEHLLLALVRQEGGVVTPILQRLGAAPEAVAARGVYFSRTEKHPGHGLGGSRAAEG